MSKYQEIWVILPVLLSDRIVLYTYIVSYTNPGICNPAKCLIDVQAGQRVAWHVEKLRLTSLFESFYTRLLSILLTMSVNFHKQKCANTITY